MDISLRILQPSMGFIPALQPSPQGRMVETQGMIMNSGPW
jgi:hypothetical protein